MSSNEQEIKEEEEEPIQADEIENHTNLSDEYTTQLQTARETSTNILRIFNSVKILGTFLIAVAVYLVYRLVDIFIDWLKALIHNRLPT